MRGHPSLGELDGRVLLIPVNTNRDRLTGRGRGEKSIQIIQRHHVLAGELKDDVVVLETVLRRLAVRRNRDDEHANVRAHAGRRPFVETDQVLHLGATPSGRGWIPGASVGIRGVGGCPEGRRARLRLQAEAGYAVAIQGDALDAERERGRGSAQLVVAMSRVDIARATRGGVLVHPVSVGRA